MAFSFCWRSGLAAAWVANLAKVRQRSKNLAQPPSLQLCMSTTSRPDLHMAFWMLDLVLPAWGKDERVMERVVLWLRLSHTLTCWMRTQHRDPSLRVSTKQRLWSKKEPLAPSQRQQHNLGGQTPESFKLQWVLVSLSILGKLRACLPSHSNYCSFPLEFSGSLGNSWVPGNWLP